MNYSLFIWNLFRILCDALILESIMTAVSICIGLVNGLIKRNNWFSTTIQPITVLRICECANKVVYTGACGHLNWSTILAVELQLQFAIDLRTAFCFSLLNPDCEKVLTMCTDCNTACGSTIKVKQNIAHRITHAELPCVIVISVHYALAHFSHLSLSHKLTFSLSCCQG